MSELQSNCDFLSRETTFVVLRSVDSELKKCWRPLPLDRMTRGREFAGAMGYSTILLDLICCNIKEDLPFIPFSYRENKRKAFFKILGGRRLAAPLEFNLYLPFYVNSSKEEVIHVSQKSIALWVDLITSNILDSREL